MRNKIDRLSEIHTHTHAHRHRQDNERVTHRQTDILLFNRQTDRVADRHADKQTVVHTNHDRQRNISTIRQTKIYIQTYTWKGHKNRNRQIWKHKYT
jgi:hypothetical protein